ncbi:MAG TPA: secretin N-terminal domain-containing protein [Thermoanaerobaculia bacterium]|nr:secretin N-terminal domain-containing protein [Thermoanaerobaculia bacterium]
MRKKKPGIRAAALGTLVLLAIGCAGDKAFRQGQDAEELGRWDVAVAKYASAREQAPREMKYKMAFDRARRKASQEHFEKGKMYLASGRPDLAVVELEQTTILDPENDYATLELNRARAQVAKIEAQRNQPSKMQRMEAEAKNARASMPILQPSSKRPISLNFPQPRPIKQIYQALGQAAGINVIFDPALKDDQATIVIANVPFQNALETLIRQENHFYKVVDAHTILIAADTPANRKTYEDLVIRTFYLSNGDVTETANAIRALLGTVHVSINKAENAITIRDTADKVSIAQNIIDQNDKEKAEVVVDVELLQMNLNKSLDLGVTYPTSISATLLAPSTAPTDTGTTGGRTTTGSSTSSTVNVITLDALKKLSLDQYGFTVPNFTVNLLKTATDAQVLAKPEMRISEGEKAQLVIGDRVPIPTTTFNTQNAVAGTGAVVPITSFQYQDVGIKIEMEPRVHHNKEVTLKLTVEVSNLNGTVPGSQGTSQPIISTRTIASTIRLKDGETNFLAGLIRKDKQNTSTGWPFLSDLPVVGRLFTDKKVDEQTTDLVMTITPHIIRVPDINEEDLVPIYVGTENNVSYQGAPRVESINDNRSPFETEQQRRRQQTQRPTPNTPARPKSPAGINLAPSGFSNSPFSFSTPPITTPPPPPPHSENNLAPGTDPSAVASAGDPSTTASLTAAAPPAQAETLASGTNDAATAADPSGSPQAATIVSGTQFAFDPPAVALAPGQEQTVLLMASGTEGVAASKLGIDFDPAVLQVSKIEPLNGGSVEPVSASRVALTLPGSGSLTGPHPIARLTLKGVAAGTGSVTVDATALTLESGGPAIVSSNPVEVEVK